MKKRKTDAGEGKGALELVEEAVQLLRRAPIPVHLFYYIGSVPFVLALLYFWSDMSRGAFAYDRIVGSSLELAFLFLWMKSWQAAGLAILRAHVSASPPPHWTPGRIWRLVVTQAALQPTALFVRPIALLITIPYPQVRAYYENAMILGDGSEGVGAVSRKAWRQAMLWKKQSIFVLLWLLLFGVMVSTNLAIIMEFLPETLRMFTGVESRFSQIDTTDWMLNTTFMAVVAAFAYLCVNPVTKATYVLRCFYGESLHTGEDLMLGMRRAIRAAAVAAAALLLAFAPAAHGADSNAPAPAPASGPAPAGRVKPGDLDNTISRVLKRDIYSWRLPRQQPGKSSNPFAQFLDDTVQKIRDGYHSFQRWLDSLHRARRDYDDMSHAKRDESVGGGFAGFLNFALWAICGIVVLLLVWLLWQNRSALRHGPRLKAQEVAAVVPDLNSEDVMASQLPEDEWMKMARDMMARGEFRLAIRALFLAMLSNLSLRELISIARYKSNRDYQRELRRRLGAQGDLPGLFGESVSIFEEAWYGDHVVTDETVGRFSANIERMKLA